ncbi:peptidase C69 [Lentilactobacillus parakefiri]|uniref:Dipeptidase n=1 Tax=Lentilactobacillus parakefiri TaxID=152332 RepID=A0A269YPV2_9LACO|nr:C69 family dipeptidase [Lentilactobacillus parakefiri]PAK87271.1 peptidase C69 [Lentilactobacillus parakefiri]PAK99427.1 peptidase C69 [Lentilactobacillus parakefiri]
MRFSRLLVGLFTTAASTGIFISANACTTVLVGKNVTTDGSTMIARNEDVDTSWAKHFIVHPATDSGPTQYVSKDNHFTVNLPAKAQRYTSTPDWQQIDGQNQFGEDGINQSNVAMSGTESATTNRNAQKADPFVKTGLKETSILDVVLPYITSAKAGVQYLGHIIETQGSAENNGVIFSDNQSIWYMEIVSGHKWAAVRVPDNRYAVVPNQTMIGKLNLKDSDRYLAAPGIVNFVKKHHLKGYHNGTIDLALAFGTNDKLDQTYDRPRVWDGQRILTPSKKQAITTKRFAMFMKPDKKICIPQIQKVLSSHFNNTKYDSNGRWVGGFRPINVPTDVESHILQIRNNVPTNIAAIQWLAMASPATSAYIPFYTNINNTPDQYKIGNDQPDSKSAYWTYKMTKVLTDPYKNKFINRRVIPTQQIVAHQLTINLANSDKHAQTLTGNDLINYLTEQNQLNANYAQTEFRQLNQQLIQDATKQTSIVHHKNL